MTYDEGTRVELVFTSDPYTNLEPGDRGTVTSVTNPPGQMARKTWVEWDDGSTLAMITGEDILEKITGSDENE